MGFELTNTYTYNNNLLINQLINFNYTQEGTCGTWTACRMLLIGRNVYYCAIPGEVHTADLRKAKNIDEYKTSGILSIL
jgi:hypothetical protein